jgi:hypothetical protein
MKYVIKIGLGTMIHLPSFIKIGSNIQNLCGGYPESMMIALTYFNFSK